MRSRPGIRHRPAPAPDADYRNLRYGDGQRANLYDYKDKLIDTSVKGIIDALDLRRPIYSQTSAYGHFGKPDLPWEQIVTA